MATVNCPKCNSPLRPGAKFCGNCGHVLAAGPAQAQPAVPQAGVGGSVCPHCGKPVRPEAKFCASCGKSIVPAPVAATPAPPVAAAPKPTPAIPAAKPAVAPQQPAVAPPTPSRPLQAASAAKAPAAKAKGKKWVLPVVIVALLAVCAVGLAGGYYVFGEKIGDPLGLFGGKTPTVSAVAPSQTAAPKATEKPGETQAPTLAPSPTQTVAPTNTAAPTEEPTATATLTLPTALVLLFEENFNGDIRNLKPNWEVWGNPRPKIVPGFEDSFLEVGAVTFGNDDAGIYSKNLFLLNPGTTIEFAARLLEAYPKLPLVFDWDPAPSIIEPDYRKGVIHIELTNEGIVIETPLTNNKCQFNLNSQEAHTFRIVAREKQALDLYVDNSAEPNCPIPDIGIAPVEGRIYLSGTGRVSYLKVLGR
ncbi:MAG: zinc ribbon domain-containing protein [Anaerolineales bacterium]|nr:zinc ribbon domain-containing protein [Anaerolineales bacterium]